MNGIDYIADTNTMLYITVNNPCIHPYVSKNLGISVITEMELLSFRRISDNEVKMIKEMMMWCKEFQLTDNIKERAILIRRTYGTKLPDAIVAATAIECNVPLISADKGFRKIEELNLQLINPS
ncbi:MAG: type II toxin-antitoxin system VapC family toxin [Bacteroidales bacterium]|nr:type II toxin-antitoxin system VapC family toxin [Bacteroidales bacterium]MDD6003919.1 type II toxin-antitoxin system VapC family toxin [Bacteroidales bacterium]